MNALFRLIEAGDGREGFRFSYRVSPKANPVNVIPHLIKGERVSSDVDVPFGKVAGYDHEDCPSR